MTDLMDAQLDIEQRSLSEGYHRYLKEQETTKVHEGAYATTEASKFIRGCIPLVSKAIESWLEDNTPTGSAGRTHRAYAILKRFDSDTLAFIALNNVFSGCLKKFPVSLVVGRIGTTLENECLAQDLEA